MTAQRLSLRPLLATPDGQDKIDGDGAKAEGRALATLELPDHLKAVVGFAVSTGLRMSNVTGLQWADVDMGRDVAVLPGNRTKNGKRIDADCEAPDYCCVDRPGDVDRSTALGRMTQFTSHGRIFQI